MRLDDTPTEQSVDSQIRKALAGQAAELDTLARQVERLQRDVASLGAASPSARASRRRRTSRIRLENLYPTQMTVILSAGGIERSYRLAPGEVRILENQPLGPFAYQVLGVNSDMQTRILTDTGFTITVYPRY